LNGTLREGIFVFGRALVALVLKNILPIAVYFGRFFAQDILDVFFEALSAELDTFFIFKLIL